MDLQPGERVIYQGHPSWRAILGFYIKGLLVAAAAAVLAGLINEGVGIGIVTFAVIAAIVVLEGFIKRVATVYTITDRRLNIKVGIIARKVQETRLQRVQNVNYNQGVYEVTSGGQDRTVPLRFTAIWAKRPSGLEFVSWQSTGIPPRQ